MRLSARTAAAAAVAATKSASTSAKAFRGYAKHVVAKLKAQRPDVVQALETRDVKALQVDKKVLERWFLRERLPPLFKDGDPFEPVTLFRGVDTGELSPKFWGEKRLLWTSTSAEDVVGYAMSHAKPGSSVAIVKYTVPRFMVHERSGWPVLRAEDVVDQTPFIHSVAKVKVGWDLSEFLRVNAGRTREVREHLQEVLPGLLEGTSKQWSLAR